MRSHVLLSFVFGLAVLAAAPSVAAKPAAVSTREVVGVLVKKDDAGYPFARLTVKVPGAAKPQEFLVNQEDAVIEGLQDGKNESMVGKSVRLILETRTVARADQVIRKGIDLNSEKAGARAKKPRQGQLTITGILSGADATQGDVAPVLTVTAKDGKKVDFDLFAPDPVVKANGKTVTLVYTLEPETRVKELRTAK